MLPRSRLQTRTPIERTLRGFPVSTEEQNIISYDLTTRKTLIKEVYKYS